MNPPRTDRPVVGIAGLGYMGLATGLAFAAHGLSVYGYDTKPEVRTFVARGSAPYHEGGLGQLLRAQLRSGRFQVVDSSEDLAVRAEGIFLCVPTPSGQGGHIDLRPLKESSEQIGRAVHSATGYRLIVVKSTVVPGTTEEIVTPIVRHHSGRLPEGLGVASNPEFLSEGTMVKDAVHPSRIVLGTTDSQSLAWLRRAYRGFRAPIFSLTPSGAELVKYSANAFLALKVSFANEVSRLSDHLGVNVDSVMAAVGHDPRIGERFLRAGPGFGGSCFEKDLRAFVARSAEMGVSLRSGEAALEINDEQLEYVLDRIRANVGPLSGKRLAILGLSFKAGTDDVRESRAFPIAERLVAAGVKVRGHDPVALNNFRRAWVGRNGPLDRRIDLCDSAESALSGVDAAILQADWPIYTNWLPSWTGRMKRPLLIDLRRAVSPKTAQRAGLTLVGLGAGNSGSQGAGRTSKGPQ
jgi:UDPglucose 6-dehydrogenase